MMISTPSIKRYDLDTIRQEACSLLETGVISSNQPLRILCDYLPAEYWNKIECELERHDYLLRDRVIDLIGKFDWEND